MLRQRLADLPFLVILMGLAAVAMLLPAVHALVVKDHLVSRAFFYSSLILLVLTAMIAIATQNYRPRDAARSQLAAVVGAYAVLPMLLALPLTQIGRDISFTESWYEMLSSFTTTGATLFSPEDLPQSAHLWRAFVGWLGGFFVLLTAVAVLAPLNLGGIEVVTGQLPGRGAVSLTPVSRIAEPSARVQRFALTLFPIYASFTLALWIGLMLAGDDSLVAFCHAMSVLSTSGISPIGGFEQSKSGLTGEVLVFAFLLISLTRRSYPSAAYVNRATPFRRDPELRLGLFLLAAVPLLLFLHHWIGLTPPSDAQPLEALWGGAFLTLSFLTTTGFDAQSVAAAEGWTGLQSPGALLIGLAIMGGGVATTAGGVKLLRLYALTRHAEREVERLIHPSSVGSAGTDGRQLRSEGAYAAWVFFMLFAISIAVFTALLTFTGLSFDASLIFAISSLTTTGPLAESLPDLPLSYDSLIGVQRSISGLAMIVGRLETLALLTLLAPDSWRR